MRVSIMRLVQLLLLSLLALGSRARGQLVINEFMASNARTIQDERGDYDDWIEIYNAGSEPIDLAGMSLTDNPSRPTKWQFPSDTPSSTTVPGYGYLLVWADDESDQGPLHASFKLSASGETLALYDTQGLSIDSITFGRQQTDMSHGRLPDGAATWRDFGSATPGATNRHGAGGIVISEVLYHPQHSTYEPENTALEWIELFNSGTEPVDLSGWQFSDGVYFTFPQVVLDGGAYLVIAADVAAFRSQHPTVTTVVGGWTDGLSNSGEILELVDATGLLADRVEYADEGDWAQRELGPIDHEHRGWIWRDDHDGDGASLELVCVDLDNDSGQNWSASTEAGGTPGRANSVAASEAAPLILDVTHGPSVPSSSDTVTVSARLLAAVADVSATLYYRADGQADFASVPMTEDSSNAGSYEGTLPAQADRTIVEFYVQASDSAGRMRTWPAPTFVDGVAQQVTNALYLVDDAFDTAALYEPDSHPVYYLIMLDRERTELEEIGDEEYSGDLLTSEPMSDAQFNATFISVDGSGVDVRYQAGVRNRGNRKRADPPMSYRVNFASDRPWQDVTALNLNSKYPHLELMGSILFQMAGLPAADVTAVRLIVNGDEPAQQDYDRTYGYYSAIEVLNADWAKHHFPDDDNGNLYRCMYYPTGSRRPIYANMDYKGEVGQTQDPNDYRLNYDKKTNEAADDWSDLFALIEALNDPAITDENFLARVAQVVNLERWTRFLAADTLIGNREGGLSAGEGDDYALYCGAVDRRFWLVPHDLDTVLGQSDHSYNPASTMWGYANVDGLTRLLSQPEVVQLYYQQCHDLNQTVLTPENIDRLVDRFLVDWVDPAELDGPEGIRQFIRDRADSVLNGGYPNADSSPQIPQAFAIVGPEVVGDYAYSTRAVLSLSGTANAIETRSVSVQGVLVDDTDWSQRNGTWSIDGIALNPGINRVIVQTFSGPDGAGQELWRESIDIWYDDGDMTVLSDTLASDTSIDAFSGPWYIPATLTVSEGVTLTIEPGTTLFFAEGAGVVVEEGGRLVAEGSDYQRIRLTRAPDNTGHWEGLLFDDTQEDNRLCYVDIEFGDDQGRSVDVQDARLLIDHVTWAQMDACVLNVDHPTVTVRDSVFPSVGSTEPIHGVGLSGDECLIFERCIFGLANGYNDIMDFTGGQRPGPILQIYDSFFLGGGDDGPDLDGTDAHIEGTVFMNFHRGHNGDSTSNAIATGLNGDDPATICVVRNLFWNNDHAVLLKEDCFLQAENNTFLDSGIAAISFGEPDRDPPRTPGQGGYVARSMFWENAAMFEHYFDGAYPDYGPTELAIDDSILPAAWHDLGVGNLEADPLFLAADDFRLKVMSPARAAGPYGQDLGAYVPAGAWVCGEPPATTHRTAVTLVVGGPGITDYRYSLNDSNGPWSEERSIDQPIELTGLQNGSSYTVYVLGKNSAGRWQEQPNASRTWTVDEASRHLVINEVMAANTSALEHEGTFPDWIEFYYDGPEAISLAGMSLSDDPQMPQKFVFPAGITLEPGEYLVVWADDTEVATSGVHVGFGLDRQGDAIYLYDTEGGLLDSVEFGWQLDDLSVGRVGYEAYWALTMATPGVTNIACPVGDSDQVRINEWLAHGEVLFVDDFIELFNPQPAPVNIGGFSLTDNPNTQPREHVLPPLTFIASNGFDVFWADGQDLSGHVSFGLSTGGEMIGLFAPGPREIDRVVYGPQVPDVSQGRAPDGAETLDAFYLPTPGVANPAVAESVVAWRTFVAEEADKTAFVPLSADSVGPDWNTDPDFDDSLWLGVSGAPGGVGYERGSGYEDMIGLDVEEAMYGGNTTCYVRIPFAVTGAEARNLAALTLSVRYDDGFVAYLNGTEVARTNISDTPQWDSSADGNHEAGAEDFDIVFDITDYAYLLVEGRNVLAIQGLNVSTTSSDFIISTVLEAAVLDWVQTEHPYLNELELLDGLRVSEVMYHAPEGDSLDYIELTNIGSEPLDLTDLRFTEGIEFVFPALQLAPGQCTVVAADQAAFQTRYGAEIPIAGVYSGRLNDGGEEIVLKLAEPFEAAIMRFEYDDAWYSTTDGGGAALVMEDLAAAPAAWDASEYWRADDPTPGDS